jgi:hypothetical protein
LIYSSVVFIINKKRRDLEPSHQYGLGSSDIAGVLAIPFCAQNNSNLKELREESRSFKFNPPYSSSGNITSRTRWARNTIEAAMTHSRIMAIGPQYLQLWKEIVV